MKYFLLKGNELYSAYDPQFSVTIVSIVPAHTRLAGKDLAYLFIRSGDPYPFDLAIAAPYH